MNTSQTNNTDSPLSKLSQLFVDHINDKAFPCVAARSSVHAGNIAFYEASHMACPHDDQNILDFLYCFIDDYRKHDTIEKDDAIEKHDTNEKHGKIVDYIKTRDSFRSAVIIFEAPEQITEEHFEIFLWKRLQALHDLDKKNYKYDSRVDSHPRSEKFSFSIKEEAFFIIGMHPGSSRLARRFKNPAIVFNPHGQFEKIKSENKYEKIKAIVRKRDERISGSINPMLADFGERSESFQYSGKLYDPGWQCPLNTDHD